VRKGIAEGSRVSQARYQFAGQELEFFGFYQILYGLLVAPSNFETDVKVPFEKR
jgi:hypothetical protein